LEGAAKLELLRVHHDRRRHHRRHCCCHQKGADPACSFQDNHRTLPISLLRDIRLFSAINDENIAVIATVIVKGQILPPAGMTIHRAVPSSLFSEIGGVQSSKTNASGRRVSAFELDCFRGIKHVRDSRRKPILMKASFHAWWNIEIMGLLSGSQDFFNDSHRSDLK
jgi:hypothetical protein